MDHHDDGLVHGHDWAREKFAHAPRRAAQETGNIVRLVADDHDDGLIHGHAWAYEPAR